MFAIAGCGEGPRPSALVREIETLARTTHLSVREIHKHVEGRASRGRVGEIGKRARSEPPAPYDHILHVS